LTLSALAGSSTITDAAVCRHRLHLLNEAGSGTDNFLVPQWQPHRPAREQSHRARMDVWCR